MSGKWTPFADWMAFSYLDDGAGLQGTFTLAYRFTDDGADTWTRRFNRFKDKNIDALAGAGLTFSKAVPALIEALGISPARSLFVPALCSAETLASDAGFVPMLTRLSAEATDIPYESKALRKQSHKPLHTLYRAVDRDAELDKARYVANRLDGASSVFVFDDLVTRGGTMSRIARALVAANNNLDVYGIALGKTERRAHRALTNEHVSERWDELWQRGEVRYSMAKSQQST